MPEPSTLMLFVTATLALLINPGPAPRRPPGGALLALGEASAHAGMAE